MRIVALLTLLLRHATAQLCTSLTGPSCAFVNNKSPLAAPESAQASASWRERRRGPAHAEPSARNARQERQPAE